MMDETQGIVAWLGQVFVSGDLWQRCMQSRSSNGHNSLFFQDLCIDSTVAERYPLTSLVSGE
jgi:hypothetical protein